MLVYQKLKLLALILINLFLFISCSQSLLNFKQESSNLFEYIKQESVEGKLDFEKSLEQNKLYVINNVAYNYKETALYTWGQAVKRLGVSNPSLAIEIYEDIFQTELQTSQKKAIKAGFIFNPNNGE